MVDTNRTRAALQALLADNTTGDISPQDLRDMLASVPVLNPSNEEVGGSYTFVLADADRSKVFNSAFAQAITIPPNSSVAFPIGTRIRCFRKGLGLPTISPGSGVTLNKPTGIRPNRFMGVMAKKSADQTTADYTVATPVTWDSEVYDTDSFHSTGVNTDRLTIPASLGIKKVIVGFNLRLSSVNLNETVWVDILKNGSIAYDGVSSEAHDSGNASTAPINTSSPGPVAATATDYFSGRLLVIGDNSVTLVAANSSLGLEVVEIDPVGSITYQYGHVTIEKTGTDEWFIEGPALG